VYVFKSTITVARIQEWSLGCAFSGIFVWKLAITVEACISGMEGVPDS